VICDRPVEAMSIHRGQLLLGKQYLPEHCPSCNKICIFTIEDNALIENPIHKKEKEEKQ
jgi:hypothetical protein